MIAVPYTARHPDTIAGVPESAEWHFVGHDPHAYWRVMCALWARGEDITIVEHDVQARPDVFASFDACANPWCACTYHDICHPECMDAWRNVLGCTRFSGELVRAVPDAVSRIEERHRDWHNLCDGIGDNLRASGWTHHWHGAVHHHKMSLASLAI